MGIFVELNFGVVKCDVVFFCLDWISYIMICVLILNKFVDELFLCVFLVDEVWVDCRRDK